MEKKNVPKIRFPGFTEPWEQRKLSEITTTIETGKSKFQSKDSGLYEILGSTSVIGYDDSYDYEGDFLLTARVGANAGNLYKYSGKVKISDNTVFIQCDNINFIYYLLMKSDIKKLSFGTGQPLVKASELKEQNLLIPTSKDERIKIGIFFEKIDNLISLHHRKLENLKKQKKGLLQKMFPEKGKKVPEMRFPEFTNDWEQRKLKEVFISLQNNTLSRAELSDKEGIAKNVHYGDILIKFGECLDIKKYTLPLIKEESIIVKYKSSFLQNGDIIVADTAEDETVGKCSEIEGLEDEIVLSGLHTIAYRPMFRFASGYLGYYMNSNLYHNQLLSLIQGIKVSSISKSAMQDTIIMYPKLIDEQAKIGEFFKQLDNLISLHQRKLEHLQKQKKALLQQMFV